MPSHAPYVCQCGKAIPSGTHCSCRARQDAQRKAYYDQQRPTARQRGYDSKWDKERKAYLTANPLCVRCGAPSTVVHHRTPHRGDLKLFWSRSNWEPVCKPCHDGPIQSWEKSQ